MCENTEFEFFSGFSLTQKQKSITSLHTSFLKNHPDMRILEVSRRSSDTIGKELSAFNLLYPLEDGSLIPVECVFQSSKVFTNGEHYPNLIYQSPAESKKFIASIHDSGNTIKEFDLFGKKYPAHPITAFYDWIYIKALMKTSSIANRIIDDRYDAFTDIEFNPNRSVNCQARTVATFVSLYRRGVIDDAMSDFENFIKLAY